MGFSKKTIRDIDVAHKRVLVRVDFNVPLTKGGKVADAYRVKQALPTIEYLLNKQAKVVLCSHLGRPNGQINKKYSLRPVAVALAQLINKKVEFLDDIFDPNTAQTINEAADGSVFMLENIRFYPQEESLDSTFAKQLAEFGDVFVQDAFGVVHHPAVSVSEMPKHMDAVAGLLVEKEVNTISEVVENPKKPFMAIIGGAKISDKIEIINRFIESADVVAIGGAMANTFLLAKGMSIGKSMAEKADVPLAKQIMERAAARSKKGRFVFYVPQDGVVAKVSDKKAKTRIVDWDAHTIAQIMHYPQKPPHESAAIHTDEMILDIGPVSAAFIAGLIQSMSTVVWNGAMGVTETKSVTGPVGPFAHGTETVISALLGEYGNKPYSVIGGGDTVGYVEERILTDSFGHVSTGGGASMELMSGKELPGLTALKDKDS